MMLERVFQSILGYDISKIRANFRAGHGFKSEARHRWRGSPINSGDFGGGGGGGRESGAERLHQIPRPGSGSEDSEWSRVRSRELIRAEG